MARNLFYKSPFWKALRKQALERDRYKCVVPGCGSQDGLTVDHIQTRPNSSDPTPLDRLDNLRCLCGYHDKQIKERNTGRRANDGKLFVIGFDENGLPLDPNHHWR